jgi:hypothetical protein
VAIVKRPDQAKGFVLLHRRWVVEGSFAWLTKFRQFVVSLAVLRHELGGLHWPTLKKRIWLNLPRSPRTGKPRKVLFYGPCRPLQQMVWAHICSSGWMRRGATGYQASTSPRTRMPKCWPTDNSRASGGFSA